MRRILSQVRRCVEDYQMLSAGDKVCVGVSGGKDSLTLLCTLARLRSFYPEKFELAAVSLDMGYHADWSAVAALCETLGVEFHLVPTNIKQVVFDIRKEKNPCSLCATLRRGALNQAAKDLGCNKVALGHHLDDAIETFFMSLFFEGRLHCFSPVTYLDRAELTKVRPMLYVYEKDIIRFASKENLPVLPSGCPVDGGTKRGEIKALIESLGGQYADVKQQVFAAIQRSDIKGWRSQTPQRGRKANIKSENESK